MFQPSAVEVTRGYEAIVIMHPDATEEEQKAIFKKNAEIIKSFNGEMNHVDTWGKRRLANPIAKNKKAIYFHSTFTAKPEAIAELERVMKINDKVLRVVHSKFDDKMTIEKHLETYKNVLGESIRREKEREAKFQAKKSARARRDGGGPRGGGKRGFDKDAPRDRDSKDNKDGGDQEPKSE